MSETERTVEISIPVSVDTREDTTEVAPPTEIVSQMNPPPAKRERLGDCEVCNQGVQGKYRCPRCSIVFCSAACCKKHKADTGCNGIRDKCVFVPLDQFNDRTMLSDYVLLEDTQRKKDNGYRTLNGISNSRHTQKAMYKLFLSNQLSQFIYLLFLNAETLSSRQSSEARRSF